MPDLDTRLRREIIGVSALLMLGSLIVLFPFLDAIIIGGATAYFLRYGHKKINKRIDNELYSSIIVISLIIGGLFLGIFAFVNNFDTISSGAVDLAQAYEEGSKDFIDSLQISEGAKTNLKSQVDNVFQPSQIRGLMTGLLTSLPAIMIDLGIFLVVALYLFKDGEKLKRKIYSKIEKLPESEEKIANTLIRSVDSIFRGVFITQFIVSVILLAIAALGFYTIGALTSPIPFTMTWAVLIGIAAFLPLIAAAMIYGPIGFYYLFFGEPVKGVLILSFGVIILNILPEVFFRPYVGSKQMDEHPLIIFLGFIAGPLTLGVKGLILGPVILIMAKDFLLNYNSLVYSGSQTRISDTD